MKGGIILPIADYHADAGIGKTTLDLIARDPYLVEWSKRAPVNGGKTKELSIGDAVHALLLEPERFTQSYVVAPELNLRTNDGKAKLAEFEAANSGKTIMSAEEGEQIRMMVDSIMAHPQARELIEADGLIERSYFWQDGPTGLRCKCRPDKFIPERGLLVDVKTTPSIAKFSYSVEDFRYYVQDPWYCDGVKKFGNDVRMAFLVAQKTAELGRYPVQIFTLPEDLILFGRQTYRRDLDRFARFLDGKERGRIQELPVHYRFIDHCVESLEVAT